MKTTYNGNTMYRKDGEFINFGLYGQDDINFEESKENIQAAFEHQFKDKIKNRLKEVGLKFEGFNYFSPREYNFADDALDLIVSIKDKKKLKKAIIENKEEIQELMNKNRSYDGYMAISETDADRELENIDKASYEVDIIALSVLLNKGVEFDFDINEHLVLENEEDEILRV